MEEVPELPRRDDNLGGEVRAASAEDDGGDVETELEEDGGSTAKVSKLNLISSLFVCVFVCWFVCWFVSCFNLHLYYSSDRFDTVVSGRVKKPIIL